MALEVDAKSCSETLYCLISALDYPGVKVLQKSSCLDKRSLAPCGWARGPMLRLN